MRNSLFVKIYLTVLASLAVVAIASGIFVHMGQEREHAGWSGRRDSFIAAMLPGDSDPALLQATVQRLSAAVDADISVYGPQGRLLASAGRLIPEHEIGSRRRIHPGGHHLLVSRLPDGRVIAARSRMPFGPAGRNPLGYLALIAGVIGLAAFPVVRHLTRRLE
ncbi:MAG: two-component sensor histidine kinase, partial [Mesorhizobium sp.]